jgi:hypothetical protein
MNELKRLVLDFRTDEFVIRTLYRTEGGSSAGPNTKARRRGAQDLPAKASARRSPPWRGRGACGYFGIHHKGGCSFGHGLTRCRQANEGSLVDVARADAVDLELDRLISKRASQDRRPDPDEQEELWKASVRAYTARRREEMRAAWASYHEAQAERHRRTLKDLVAHHEIQAAKLCEGEGVHS